MRSGGVILPIACYIATLCGTTPGPMFFAQGYTAMGTWWRISLIFFVVNIIIFATVGFTWWKIVGFW